MSLLWLDKTELLGVLLGIVMCGMVNLIIAIVIIIVIVMCEMVNLIAVRCKMVNLVLLHF